VRKFGSSAAAYQARLGSDELGLSFSIFSSALCAVGLGALARPRRPARVVSRQAVLLRLQVCDSFLVAHARRRRQ
jgi:hypothetical protein